MTDLGFPAGPLAIAYAANGEHERATDLYYSFRMLLGTMFMSPPGMADPYDISIAYPAIYIGHAELVMKIYPQQMIGRNVPIQAELVEASCAARRSPIIAWHPSEF
ncbi:hypothetical protein [Novosphingobium sp. UBA1939]|uniref:hypothetical protein n=1 Tax=Novosphingobium sp. UBA1939 TaxID=1946982 RepID=UPI0025F52F25|nr:hypothetical protein [Novosphingobium sp. UBA1939]